MFKGEFSLEEEPFADVHEPKRKLSRLHRTGIDEFLFSTSASPPISGFDSPTPPSAQHLQGVGQANGGGRSTGQVNLASFAGAISVS